MTERWAYRLRELASQEHIPGAVLGVWTDGAETVAVHGVLSAATRVAATPDSLFQIGSISKVWTATMIMQLTEEGRLSLDTTVAQLLPGVPLDATGRQRRDHGRHLLTHTSGIDGDIFADTGRGDDCLERYVDGLAAARRGSSRRAAGTPTATAGSCWRAASSRCWTAGPGTLRCASG